MSNGWIIEQLNHGSTCISFGQEVTCFQNICYGCKMALDTKFPNLARFQNDFHFFKICSGSGKNCILRYKHIKTFNVNLSIVNADDPVEVVLQIFPLKYILEKSFYWVKPKIISFKQNVQKAPSAHLGFFYFRVHIICLSLSIMDHVDIWASHQFSIFSCHKGLACYTDDYNVSLFTDSVIMHLRKK